MRGGDPDAENRLLTMASGTVPFLCFPPAGVGASFYHSWLGEPGPLEVTPVEPPGKETRFNEKPRSSMPDMARDLAAELMVRMPGGRGVLFGHCFGAVLAHEVALALTAREPALELALVVSGSPPPGVTWGRPLTGLPDDGFMTGVRELAGYSPPAFENEELRELLLPGLRADVLMHETYRPHPGSRLTIPVMCIRGSADRTVSVAEAEGWRQTTTGHFRSAELPGDHMYLLDAWPSVLELVREALCEPPEE
jgi:surfactin synthase thioesterase subunit